MSQEESLSQQRQFYDFIFNLYSIDFSIGTGKKRPAYRKEIQKRRKNYEKKRSLSGVSWDNWSEADKAIFLCYEIKDYMMEDMDTTKQRSVQKRLDKYMEDRITKGELLFEKRNTAVKNQFSQKGYLNKNMKESQKKEAYQRYCQDVKDFQGASVPLSYEDFLKNPEYDIIDLDRSTLDIKFQYATAVSNIVQDILIEVLHKEIGLEIDIDKIEQCLIERDAIRERRPKYDFSKRPYSDEIKNLGINPEEFVNIDLSDYEYTQFPSTFEEYWANVTNGMEESYTEAEQMVVHQQYDEAKEKYRDLLMINDKLKTLGNFYKIKKEIQKQLKDYVDGEF